MSGCRAWLSGGSKRWNLRILRLVSDMSGREEYNFVTPEMFHLRPLIEILLRVQYVNSARRPGEPIIEGNIQGHISSLCGTFNICPYTVFKPGVSNFQNCQLEFDRPVCSSCVLLCVNEREVDYGGANIRNRRTTDGAAGRKVGETSDIESYGFVAKSSVKCLKLSRTIMHTWRASSEGF